MWPTTSSNCIDSLGEICNPAVPMHRASVGTDSPGSEAGVRPTSDGLGGLGRVDQLLETTVESRRVEGKTDGMPFGEGLDLERDKGGGGARQGPSPSPPAARHPKVGLEASAARGMAG